MKRDWCVKLINLPTSVIRFPRQRAILNVTILLQRTALLYFSIHLMGEMLFIKVSHFTVNEPIRLTGKCKEARILESRVPIPLEALISPHIFYVCVLCR
jgi:transposase-like protein